jgi:hypothetical protein
MTIHQMLLGGGGPFEFSITSNINDANLRTLALAAGWNGVSKVIATINAGVVVGASSTGSYGLTINGSFPLGGRLINKGYVIGRGGNGGSGASSGIPVAATSGTAGGPALLVSVPFEIDNSAATIGGGGGGGGGGGSAAGSETGGGGGGGGRSSNVNSSGGGGGYGSIAYGGSGGPGSFATAGGGGPAGTGSAISSGAGGGGGGWGSSGASGVNSGNSGSPWHNGVGGSAGGAAVVGNSNITWIATGTRLGAIT